MTNSQSNTFKLFLNVFTLLHFDYLDDAEKELNALLDNNMPLTPADHKGYCRDVAQTLLGWIQTIKKEKARV